MKLNDLYLEHIPTPLGYRDVIIDRKELTPELKAQNFMEGVWGKGRRYNFFLIMDGYEPFKLRIIEDNVKEDLTTGVLEYHVEIDTDHTLFKPFKLQKYIREQEAGKALKMFNQKLGAWLIEEVEKRSGVEMYNDLHVEMPENQPYILFRVNDEKVYDQLRVDISAALRSLSAVVERMDDTPEFAYDDMEPIEDKRTMKELRAIKSEQELEKIFYNTISQGYTSAAYFAVKEAVKKLEAEGQKTTHLYFVVDVDKGCIRFTLEEEYPENDDSAYFYNHKVADNILRKFDYLCSAMSLRPSSEAAYYFGQALNALDEKGAFDKVRANMIEVMGTYAYYGDMEGIFCK